MTDKESLLRLGAGTVPDPFGLAEDPARLLSDEEAPDPDSPSTPTSQDMALAEDEDFGQSEVGTGRLGELD
jgi:hypothetical protein